MEGYRSRVLLRVVSAVYRLQILKRDLRTGWVVLLGNLGCRGVILRSEGLVVIKLSMFPMSSMPARSIT